MPENTAGANPSQPIGPPPNNAGAVPQQWPIVTTHPYPYVTTWTGTAATPPPAEEPTADARAFARTIRDQYVALRAEGFTEREAVAIIGAAIAAALGREQ